MKYMKITLKNLKACYNNLNGNIYYLDPDDGKFYIFEGFHYLDLESFLRNGCQMIYVDGPARSPFIL